MSPTHCPPSARLFTDRAYGLAGKRLDLQKKAGRKEVGENHWSRARHHVSETRNVAWVLDLSHRAPSSAFPKAARDERGLEPKLLEMQFHELTTKGASHGWCPFAVLKTLWNLCDECVGFFDTAQLCLESRKVRRATHFAQIVLRVFSSCRRVTTMWHRVEPTSTPCSRCVTTRKLW